MQAGTLILPYDLVLLPEENTRNSSLDDDYDEKETRDGFLVPDFVFLIEHTPTGDTYVFDLGMRKDLDNSTPSVVETIASNFDCKPRSPADILRKYGTLRQQPEHVKAIIFSHLHFDHCGDFGKDGFDKAELWLGPGTCMSFRPGYPADEDGEVYSEDLPTDGSRKIVEFTTYHEAEEADQEGVYEGIELRYPLEEDAEGDRSAGVWHRLGSFDKAFDVFCDGAMYIIDAPGHTAGHQMLLLRVKTRPDDEDDDFVLLTGDCYHHPALLENPWGPRRMARPPYSKSCMHEDPEAAMNTLCQTKSMAYEQNVWAIGAHDFTVGKAISPGTETVEGLVLLNEWREKGWKGHKKRKDSA